MASKNYGPRAATAKELFEHIVIPAARENAFQTEGLRALAKSRGVRIDETIEFQRMVYASAASVIDSLSSPREASNYNSKPISVATYQALSKLLANEFAWLPKAEQASEKPFPKGGGLIGATARALAYDCDHSHPPEVPSSPCATGAREVAPVAHEVAPVAHASSSASASALSAPDCLPWLEVNRIPENYTECLAKASALGPIKDASDVYRVLSGYLAKKDQECFVVVLTDIRGQSRGISQVALGQRSSVAVGVSDIMRVVVATGAERFFVVHNHPTGNAKPSKEDGNLTDTIRKAFKPLQSDCEMLDHVVIGIGEYYSFANKKLYKTKKGTS